MGGWERASSGLILASEWTSQSLRWEAYGHPGLPTSLLCTRKTTGIQQQLLASGRGASACRWEAHIRVRGWACVSLPHLGLFKPPKPHEIFTCRQRMEITSPGASHECVQNEPSLVLPAGGGGRHASHGRRGCQGLQRASTQNGPGSGLGLRKAVPTGPGGGQALLLR